MRAGSTHLNRKGNRHRPARIISASREAATRPASREAVTMNVYSFDPLQDPRWARFVQGHPRASVFHTSGWLRSLQRTYRFAPIAFTTSGPAEDLGHALVFCGVRSWLTGDP